MCVLPVNQSVNLTALVNRAGGPGPLRHIYSYLQFSELWSPSRVTRGDYAAWGHAVHYVELKGIKISFFDLQKLINRTHRLQELILRPLPATSGYEGLDANLLQLRDVPLHSLTIQNQQITPEILNQLRPDSLSYLHIMDSVFSLPPHSFVLQRFSHLKSLTLEGCCLNGETLKQIATIRSLERLVLSSCHMSQSWMPGNNLNITTLPDFTTLPALTELTIRGAQIDVENFGKLLQQLPRLRVLVYNDCEAIDKTYFEKLEANCPRLEVLDVADCENITDEALEPLSTLPSLKALDFTGCTNLTADGIQKFEKDRLERGLPAVKIDGRPVN